MSEVTKASGRTAATASRYVVAWLAIAIAIYELITFVLQASGASERMLMRADAGGILGMYNFVFGILPTFLGFGLLIGYWWAFRGTRGQLPAFVAIALSVISQVLSNLWPYLSGRSGAATSALMWIASASGLAVLLAIAVAVAWSDMLPRHVVFLAFAFFALQALVRLAGLVFRTWRSAFIPFVPHVDAGIRGVQQYGGTLVQVTFLLSFALALLATKLRSEPPLAGV